MPCSVYLSFIYEVSRQNYMAKRDKVSVSKKELPSTGMDNALNDFRREMEAMLRSWPLGWQFPRMSEMNAPICDMVNRRATYELQVELPSVEKDAINIQASRDSVEISGERSEKSSEKRKDYVYNERSYRTFYRKMRVPEEIDPSKVSAKMSNGILAVEMPKRAPLKSKETAKVEIK